MTEVTPPYEIINGRVYCKEAAREIMETSDLWDHPYERQSLIADKESERMVALSRLINIENLKAICDRSIVDCVGFSMNLPALSNVNIIPLAPYTELNRFMRHIQDYECTVIWTSDEPIYVKDDDRSKEWDDDRVEHYSTEATRIAKFIRALYESLDIPIVYSGDMDYVLNEGSGLFIISGCSCSGKTTLLNRMKEEAKCLK